MSLALSLLRFLPSS